jgi:hypothetical protein
MGFIECGCAKLSGGVKCGMLLDVDDDDGFVLVDRLPDPDGIRGDVAKVARNCARRLLREDPDFFQVRRED